MMFNLVALVVIFFVSLTHYSIGKSVLVSLGIFIVGFLVWFLAEMLGMLVVGSIYGKTRKGGDALTDPKELNDYNNKSDYIGAGAGIVGGVLVLLAFHLFNVSHFTQGLFFLAFGMFVLISYLDRVFTKMSHQFLPVLAQSAVYFSVAFNFFK